MADILIVDDKEDALYILRTILTDSGYSVRQARHGAEALALARSHPPDAIISDLLMPVMDGYMLLRWWKADEKLKSIPFIVYTATYTDSKDEKLARDLGADEFLIKPIEPDEFLKNLENILVKYRKEKTAIPRIPDGNISQQNTLYNEILIRKLEEKAMQLSKANKALEMDIMERELAQKEKEKLQEQLFQAQKMEFVGRLAGGIAHDFNNMLTAIICSGEAMKEKLGKNTQALEMLGDILEAAQRASALTAQLLAFSRKQILKPAPVDLNEIVSSMIKMLHRIIGEDIKLNFKPHPSPCYVLVDESQISQVILNLAVNARDAMKDGGELKIYTVLENPGKDFFRKNPEFEDSPVVRLSFCDSGKGMSEETKRHIFEPFFTTKEKGAGTGLGLATVYGIVKQSGGAIEVESWPNKGTTFHIYLPHLKSAENTKREKAETPQNQETGGRESILFVEDDDSVRRVWERILKEKGYSVICARDPYDALKKLEKAANIDLLITDLVMPGMSGRQLAEEIMKKKICHRVLYISGYTEDTTIRHGITGKEIDFIQKPFTVNNFLRKIRETLKK
ncbi:MAG: hypothetical protein Fur0012_02350 [Elusimicrobiota bacterium]